jgi:hypothetical protein
MHLNLRYLVKYLIAVVFFQAGLNLFADNCAFPNCWSYNVTGGTSASNVTLTHQSGCSLIPNSVIKSGVASQINSESGMAQSQNCGPCPCTNQTNLTTGPNTITLNNYATGHGSCTISFSVVVNVTALSGGSNSYGTCTPGA